MGDRPRVGLVGTGFGTRVHLPRFAAFRGDVEVVEVCSAQRTRAQEAARPGDVSMAQLCDGFGYVCPQWLEALGFCARGEAAALEGGRRIARDGRGRLLARGMPHGRLGRRWPARWLPVADHPLITEIGPFMRRTRWRSSATLTHTTAVTGGRTG